MVRAMPVIVACLLAMLLGCGGVGPKKGGEAPAKQAAGKTYAAGDVIDLAPLKVTFRQARVTSLVGEQFRQSVSSRVLRVEFTLENASPVKVADWGGWQGSGSVKDEHGNTFRPYNPSSSFRFATDEEADAYDAAVRVDPGKRLTRHLYFQPAPPSSKQATLELPLSVLGHGADGDVRVRLEIQHLKED